jgi:hypothetical protein
MADKLPLTIDLEAIRARAIDGFDDEELASVSADFRRNAVVVDCVGVATYEDDVKARMLAAHLNRAFARRVAPLQRDVRDLLELVDAQSCVLIEARAEAARMKDAWLRSAADFDNFRKRARERVQSGFAFEPDAEDDK